MNTILLGNGFTLLGSVIMVLCGLITDNKKYLITQSAQFALMGIGNAVLGGMTGMISNLSGMLRNLWTCYFKLKCMGKTGFHRASDSAFAFRRSHHADQLTAPAFRRSVHLVY